ncbi:hypothetical protein S40288_03257 [Stachybotrys chartarum IBT 40288]|nr:hypothetical protein S40288_03257 [Stachybotrys chartarum IBT 40288]
MLRIDFLVALIALPSLILAAPSGFNSFASTKRQVNSWPQDLNGLVVEVDDPSFDELSVRWSTFEPPTFDAVFVPESEEDLTNGLAYLTSEGIPFLTKSGGHGYSITLNSIQDAVQINMAAFNSVTMNEDLSVTVGSGANLNDFVQVVGGAGREAPVGSCPCVGVMGATLGGGIGRLQGLHGLMSDAVRSFRIALWNGTLIEASADVNSNLFWGMRGAGQNFGVVTEAVFETYPATNGGLNYEAQLELPVETLGEIIDLINPMLPLDPALAIVTIVASNATTLETVVLMNIVYIGPEEEGRAYAQPFIDLSVNSVESILTWVDLPTQGSGGFNNVQCVPGRRNDLYGQTIATIDKESVLEMTQSLTTLIQENPLLNASSFLIESFPVQRLDAIPKRSSAFPHRGHVDHYFEILVSFTDDSVSEVGDNWAREWRNHFSQPEVSGWDSWVIYQNYAHGDEPPSILYGTERWRQARLTALKNTYDPHGFFDGYHPIPRRLQDWS